MLPARFYKPLTVEQRAQLTRFCEARGIAAKPIAKKTIVYNGQEHVVRVYAAGMASGTDPHVSAQPKALPVLHEIGCGARIEPKYFTG